MHPDLIAKPHSHSHHHRPSHRPTSSGLAVAIAPGLTAEVPGLATAAWFLVLGLLVGLRQVLEEVLCVALGALLKQDDVGMPGRVPRPRLPRVTPEPLHSAGTDEPDEAVSGRN
ncbi:hypothetical protein V8E53_001725, partial [Lactarius tabidus]